MARSGLRRTRPGEGSFRIQILVPDGASLSTASRGEGGERDDQGYGRRTASSFTSNGRSSITDPSRPMYVARYAPGRRLASGQVLVCGGPAGTRCGCEAPTTMLSESLNSTLATRGSLTSIETRIGWHTTNTSLEAGRCLGSTRVFTEHTSVRARSSGDAMVARTIEGTEGVGR